MRLSLPSPTQLVRGLRKQPGFSLLAILTLALGIGVNVAIFSALDALVINPLPYPDANRLVAVYEEAAWVGYPKNTPAPANFFDWKREAKSFDDMAATSSCRAVLTGDGIPEEVRCRNVTANIFPMLQVTPVLGSWFTAADDHPQPDAVIIGEGLWTRRYGRDAGILHRKVQINGRAMRVAGVMPSWFRFGGEMELWMPIGFTPQQKAMRGSHFLTCFGRLKPGVSVAQADAELRTIQSRLNQAYPDDTDPRMSARVESLRDALAGDVRASLLILMGAAGIVLLIAFANVANLLLARATGRQREMALRTALGASAGDLLAHVFSETLFLTLSGGTAGVLLAFAARRVLENFIPQALKGTVAIEIDIRVLLFATLISLGAAVLAAVTPVLHVLRAPLMNLLRQDSRTGAARSAVRMRGILVVAEVALTVVLLGGAGLMIRSLVAIWQTDLGFRPAQLLTMRVSVPALKYADDTKRFDFYERMVEKIRALPDVAAADFASTPPFFSIGNSRGFAIEGRTPPGRFEAGDMLTRNGTNGYLQTIGATLAAGRFFNASDREGAVDAIIVNESYARTFHPGESALGKRMTFSERDNKPRWRTIVGVVKEINERGYDWKPKPAVYVPLRQVAGTFVSQLLVRSRTASPERLVNSIRQAIQEIDPDQPIASPRTFEELLALDQANRRQQMFLLAAFSALSLLMACLGIYAILAYTVEMRRQEIGIRMALGACSGEVMRMVAWDGMRLAILGGAMGLVISAASVKVLQASLYGVQPFDPLTLAAVCALLTMVALLACWVPARRAAATAPGVALRS
ncbi:MAG: ABC transporter permease [Candidatus Solibacter usitatus]|nr:ABC transporter permease [Candidatus Solibacter usitatus]